MEEQWTLIKGLAAAIGGTIVYFLGGLDHLLIALMALIVLDYLSGLMKGWHVRNLSSELGFRGISKKVMILGVVAMAYIVQGLLQNTLPLREITIMFFVANEGISILENADAMGLPLPARLGAVLNQMRREQD